MILTKVISYSKNEIISAKAESLCVLQKTLSNVPPFFILHGEMKPDDYQRVESWGYPIIVRSADDDTTSQRGRFESVVVRNESAINAAIQTVQESYRTSGLSSDSPIIIQKYIDPLYSGSITVSGQIIEFIWGDGPAMVSSASSSVYHLVVTPDMKDAGCRIIEKESYGRWEYYKGKMDELLQTIMEKIRNLHAQPTNLLTYFIGAGKPYEIEFVVSKTSTDIADNIFVCQLKPAHKLSVSEQLYQFPPYIIRVNELDQSSANGTVEVVKRQEQLRSLRNGIIYAVSLTEGGNVEFEGEDDPALQRKPGGQFLDLIQNQDQMPSAILLNRGYRTQHVCSQIGSLPTFVASVGDSTWANLISLNDQHVTISLTQTNRKWSTTKINISPSLQLTEPKAEIRSPMEAYISKLAVVGNEGDTRGDIVEISSDNTILRRTILIKNSPLKIQLDQKIDTDMIDFGQWTLKDIIDYLCKFQRFTIHGATEPLIGITIFGQAIMTHTNGSTEIYNLHPKMGNTQLIGSADEAIYRTYERITQTAHASPTDDGFYLEFIGEWSIDQQITLLQNLRKAGFKPTNCTEIYVRQLSPFT
jgi:hypothetical protein